MGSAFSAGTGNFQALKTAGSCDIANITFSGFNTSLNATDLLVSADGGVAKGSNRLIGLSYTYLDGSLPTGSIGYRHIDPMEGPGRPIGFPSVESPALRRSFSLSRVRQPEPS